MLAKAWRPTYIHGCKLWLKADVGVTQSAGLVSNWADQSGNGNDVSQATAALKPTFNATSINGKPGVTYNGSNNGTFAMGLVTSNNIVPSGAARSVFLVCNPTSASAGYPFAFRQAQPIFAGVLGLIGARYVFYDGTDLTTVPSPIWNGVPTAAEWVSTGAGAGALTVTLNGTPQTLSPNGNVVSDTGTSGFILGCSHHYVGSAFIGDICEVLIYDHAVTGTELTAVRTYLHSRYLVP